MPKVTQLASHRPHIQTQASVALEFMLTASLKLLSNKIYSKLEVNKYKGEKLNREGRQGRCERYGFK